MLLQLLHCHERACVAAACACVGWRLGCGISRHCEQMWHGVPGASPAGLEALVALLACHSATGQPLSHDWPSLLPGVGCFIGKPLPFARL